MIIAFLTSTYGMLSILAFLVGVFLKLRSKWSELPPGPWGLPLVGYLPFLDKSKPLRQTFDEMGQLYGEVFTLKLGTHQAVVLTTGKVVQECYKMEEFSGRPNSTLANQIYVDAGERSITHAEGPQWSFNRKVGVKAVGVWDLPVTRDRLLEVMDQAHEYLLGNIRNLGPDGMDPLEGLFPYVAGFMETITYGGQFAPNGQFVQDMLRFAQDGALDVERNVYLEFAPFLRRFYTGAIAKQQRQAMEVLNTLHRNKKGGEEGISQKLDSVIGRIPNDDKTQAGVTDPFTRDLVTDCYLGGLMGIWENLSWCLLLLAKNPLFQRKLQVELDTANSGQKTTPSFEVLSDNIFLDACVLEALRYASTEGIGMEHRATQDVEFEGYRIPKDSIVISNLYSVNIDSRFFDLPLDYRPTRFLLEDGNWKPGLASKVMAFSCGKRSCIGEHLARSILITTVGLLAFHFNIDLASGSRALDNLKITAFKVKPGDHKLRFKKRF